MEVAASQHLPTFLVPFTDVVLSEAYDCVINAEASAVKAGFILFLA